MRSVSRPRTTWPEVITDEEREAGKPPTFLVIGAAKAGTTALYSYLNRDPRIHMADPKEPGFFAYDQRFETGFDTYCGLWAGADWSQQRGEMTTSHSCRELWPEASTRIAASLPDVKFIYLVRDPVARTYSHYAWRMRYGVTMTFEEALTEMPDIESRSRYFHQLEPHRAHVDRERILVLDTAGQKADPDAFMRRIQRFLGLEARSVVEGPEVRANLGDRRRRSLVVGDARRRLPGLAMAGRVVPRAAKARLYQLYLRTRSGGRSVETHTPPAARSDTLDLLRSVFREDAYRLADEYDVDVTGWSLEPESSRSG